MPMGIPVRAGLPSAAAWAYERQWVMRDEREGMGSFRSSRIRSTMILDIHVHISAMSAGHGWMSRRLLESLPFRFMRWRLGLKGEDEATERALEARLAATIAESGVDAAVILAFDAVHDRDGRRDEPNTHLYVTNDY